MVDKDFEKITYEDNNLNVKGTFSTFHFESEGSSAPFNEGYGQNLTVTREMKKEKVPMMGFISPLKIEQEREGADVYVKLALTTLQARKDQYGMLFAIKFLNDTNKAIESWAVYTSDGSVNTAHSLKSIGGLTVNGNTYEYFLAKVNADTQSRTSTVVQLNFYAGLLTNDRMSIEIYEGFTFENFTNGDYASANLTTHTPYPHQKDFDKHKFRDVMSGNVLLAGTKLGDGTVKAGESLRLERVNLGNIIPYHMTFCLGYTGIGTANWSLPSHTASYPGPILPCRGTGEITIHILTHSFDSDSVIPTSNFTLQYRFNGYKESSNDYHLGPTISYTNEDGMTPVIKRNGHVFYLNRKLSYNPPADCIGYRLEFRQVKPTTGLGNESNLTCSIEQERT